MRWRCVGQGVLESRPVLQIEWNLVLDGRVFGMQDASGDSKSGNFAMHCGLWDVELIPSSLSLDI